MIILTIQNKIEQIDEKYGKGKVQLLDSLAKEAEGIKYISTGSYYLDKKLGYGWPMCIMAEVIGEEMSGKSTVCLHAIAEAQKAYPDKYCVFIDVEHAFNAKYAKDLGVNTKDLVISQPDSAEEAFDLTEDFVREQDCSVCIVDSIAGLVPEEELEKPLSENSVSKLPLLLGRATRKLKNIVEKSDTLLIWTNQYRIVRFQPFVQKGTPGGNAMRYFTSMRVALKRESNLITQKIDGEDVNIGQIVTANVIKNKYAPPYREAEFRLMFGQGISRIDELIDLGIQKKVIHKGGTWYEYNDIKVQGRYNFFNELKNNKKALSDLEQIGHKYVFGK